MMGAAHEVNDAVSGNSGALVNCNFNITSIPTFPIPAGGQVGDGVNTLPGSNGNGLSTTGHPGDQWGYVLGAGLRLNFPMVAQGDYFQAQGQYTQGGLRYLMQAINGPNFGIERGGKFGYGVVSDCAYTAHQLLSSGMCLAFPPPMGPAAT